MADIIIRTGFENIHHKIAFHPQSERKADDLITSGHVKEIEELRNNGKSYLIRCQVIRQISVSLTPYKVQVHVRTRMG